MLNNKKPVMRRRGVVCVIVAVSLVALLAIVALVLEGGHLVDKRRQAQTVADAAAYGAAIEMLAGGSSKEALTRARASALSLASSIGFSNDGVTSTVAVNFPPKSGPSAGKDGYVEVVVQYLHTRAFSRIMSGEEIRIEARSIAVGSFQPTKASLLILEPKKNGALRLSSGNLVANGDIFVNSKGKDAVQVKKNSGINTDSLVVSGRIKKDSRNRITGEVTQQVPPAENPLADLPAPEAGPSPKATDYLTTVNGQKIYALQPGTYADLKFDSNDLVTMAPGTYVMNGEFRIKDQASLLANEVVLVNTKKDMKFETHGSVTITPATTGIYAGISIFQPGSSKHKISFRNDGQYDVEGTIYTPNGTVRFQKVDLTLGGFADDTADDPDEEMDSFDDTEDASGDDSQAGIRAQIISRRLMLDKRTSLTINGNGLELLKPYLAVVE